MTFKCKNGFYFEDDRNKETIKSLCNADGTFTQPNNTEFKCVVDITCAHEPPEEPTNGARLWNGDSNYEAQVKYNCGPHGTFKINHDEVDEIVATCRWNKTWSVATLPDCHCKYF